MSLRDAEVGLSLPSEVFRKQVEGSGGGHDVGRDGNIHEVRALRDHALYRVSGTLWMEGRREEAKGAGTQTAVSASHSSASRVRVLRARS